MTRQKKRTEGKAPSRPIDGDAATTSQQLPALPRICILDADDSYTNSIVKLISDVYPEGSEERKQVDQRIVVLRERDIGFHNLVRVLPEFAAIILGPGPGRPEPEVNDASPSPTLTSDIVGEKGAEAPPRRFKHPAEMFTHLLAEHPFPTPIPTLGICLGHQALACAFGGKVVQAPRILHGQICRLQLEPSASRDDSVLNSIREGERVVRYNSLTVDPVSVGGEGSELEVTAWAVDGKETERSIMGLQHRSLPYWSVQYHPESICSDHGKDLIASFLRLVASSDHVQNQVKPDKAFSTLQPELLHLSRICNPFNSNHSLFKYPVENELTPFFELRTRPLGRPGPSPHTPQDVFEVLVKGQTPLGEVWLDSSKFPLPPRPDFAAAAAAARAEREKAEKSKGNGDLVVDSKPADQTDGAHGSEATTTAERGAKAEPSSLGGPDEGTPMDVDQDPAATTSSTNQGASMPSDAANVPWPPPGDHNCRFSHLASADILVSYFTASRVAWSTNPELHRTRLPLQGRNTPDGFWTWLSGAQEVVAGLTTVCGMGESKWEREGWEERIKRGEKPGQEALEGKIEGQDGEKKDGEGMLVEAKPSVNGDASASKPEEHGAIGNAVNGDASKQNGSEKPPEAGSTSPSQPQQHKEPPPAADGTNGVDGIQTDPADGRSPAKSRHGGPDIPLPPIGWYGYLGYELLSESLDGHRLRPRGLPEYERVPDAELAFSFCAFTYDHVERQWYASALVRRESVSVNSYLLVEALERRLGTRIGFAEEDYAAWMDAQEQTFIIEEDPEVTAQQEEELAKQAEHAAIHAYRPLHLRPLRSEIEYQQAVDRAQHQIAEGESYELCLTTTFKSTLQRRKGAVHHAKQDDCPVHDAGSHYPLYLKLREANPAPHSAYIRFAPYDTSILSSSPERFMRIDRNGNVEMKPIKGTTKRRLDSEEEDKKVMARLKGDLKERAENLMITDLIRHDLLRFCEVESVKVPKLISLETNATVHNLVSTVVGKLKADINAADALKMAFPPGSMTGAPKLRSVELLDELEEGRPRGVYSGVLGYMGVDGTADWSVVIRTAVIRERQLTIGTGGAITSLSKRENEWEEVLTKVNAVGEQLAA